MHRKAAIQILNKARSMYAAEHVYQTVNPRDFGHLSHNFYHDMQQDLESLGFRRVADVEDETVKRQKPDPRTFLRIMTTNDGTVNAAIYQIHPSILWRLLMFASGMRTTKVVELQTELENRYQVITTTVRSQDLFPNSPKLFRNFQPRGTPIERLCESHQGVIERVAIEADVKPIPNAALEDILEFENRQMALQREYLESVGWVTKDYLLKQSGGNSKLAESLFDEIQKILKEEEQNA